MKKEANMVAFFNKAKAVIQSCVTMKHLDVSARAVDNFYTTFSVGYDDRILRVMMQVLTRELRIKFYQITNHA